MPPNSFGGVVTGGNEGAGEDRVQGDEDMRIIVILCMMALAALAVPTAAEFPPPVPSGCAVSGTFAPHPMGYFQDFQISYRIEGVLAEAFDDQVSQVRASRHYHLLEVVSGATEVRVSGSASGGSLGGSQQYAGSLTVELRVGDETESSDIPIERGSYPPYSFDVSLPIPAGIDPSVSFKITTGMRWPNGFFPIYVSGDMRPCPAEGCSDYCPSSKEVLEEEILEEEDEPIELSENAKLLKILDQYNSKIPLGIASSGSKNNLLSWFNSTYDDYTCGAYQLRVLQLLDSLKWSDDPHERALFDGWDYGPIEALYGGHQAVVIYPKGTDWADTGIVLDPWVDQRPKMYDIHTWAGIFSPESYVSSIIGYGGPLSGPMEAGSFHGIRGSSLYEGDPGRQVYPTVGGNYIDPKVTRLSEAEEEWIQKNLDPEKRRQLSIRFPERFHQRIWIQMRMDKEKKNGSVMGYSPLNLYLVDDDGNISGFPGGVPTAEMDEISMKRFLLDDGTYWTELQYPQERSYNLVVEGTDDGRADLFMGYGMEGVEDRSVFRYHMTIALDEWFEAPADSRGGPLYSGSRSVEAEEIQEINRSWLETKPDIVAPQEYEVIIEDGEISASTKAAGSGPTVEEAAEPAIADPKRGVDAVDHNAGEFVQWAARATASSEYSSTGWSALQATGEPDTYPSHGDIRTAWASLEEDAGIEWLDLEYEVPVRISRIEIYETYNPGAITGIEIYDQNGGRQLAWEESMEPARTARISPIEIDADFPSDRIRIILDTRRVSGWNEIDAVALTGSRPLPQSDLWSYGDVLIDAPPGGWEGVEPGEAI